MKYIIRWQRLSPVTGKTTEYIEELNLKELNDCLKYIEARNNCTLVNIRPTE